jgi:hypothetical protein
MLLGQIDFPELLIDALNRDELVIFVGAGVSMGEPAKLPDFRELAKSIAEGTGEILQKNESEDHFLGRLHHKKVNIYERTKEIFSNNAPKPTQLHHNLLRLYLNSEKVKIVTTNFDLFFEQAAVSVFADSKKDKIEVFRAPALPLGNKFNGITYLHGSLNRPDEMILTDADFGRAYLTEGWARRFLIDMFRNFTILFIGYSYNDVIVSYLTRSIPKSDLKNLFVLTEEKNELEKWQLLGIEPVIFSITEETGYTALYEGVKQFADMARYGIFDWQKRIKDLAVMPPPLLQEDIDIIEYALKKVETTRFFTKSAKLPEWIDWLDERNYLDSLFNNGKLSECDIELSVWLAENFAVSHSDKFFLLIGKHNLTLNSRFWHILVGKIAENESIDNDLLSQWVFILLSTRPSEYDNFIFFWLAGLCIKIDNIDCLLRMFNEMAKTRIQIKPAFYLPDEDYNQQRSKIDIKVDCNAHTYELNDIWEKGLKPNLYKISEELLTLVITHLKEQHFILRAWQKLRYISFRRSAIEPHEQDKYPEPIDILIDIGRDSLSWLAENKPKLSAIWCDKLINSDIAILRRLAVYTTELRQDVSSDKKLAWLLSNINLYDIDAQHEIYQLIKLIYPTINFKNRKRLIQKILSYKATYSNKEEDSAWEHFQWLHWIHTAAPDCIYVKQALENIKSKYPDFEPSDHPDLTHWIGYAKRAGTESPFTVKALLEKKPKELLPALLSYQANKHDRYSFITSILEAVKSNFSWGINLAYELNKTENWDTDIWTGIIRGWREAKLDDKQKQEVLNFFKNDKLFSKHSDIIADVLYGLLKNGSDDLLSKSNKIASNLWQHLNRNIEDKKNDDWLQEARNHPAGIIAKFWVRSLSIWYDNQEKKPKFFNSEYKKAFDDIINDKTLVGRLGKTVIASQFRLLLTVDEKWTCENLLPLFYPSEENSDYQAVWDGFLWGKLNPATAEVLAEPFLKAINYLNTILSKYKERFIKFYTEYIFYYIDNPFEKWLPALFKNASIELRTSFSHDIDYYLINMKKEQQINCWERWLKKYWQNRLQGVPASLEKNEVKIMLEWLPYLTEVFPEAVELAIQMPKFSVRPSMLLYHLQNKRELVKNHPDSVADLLIYLDKIESDVYRWENEYIKKITDRLMSIGIKEEYKEKLTEMLVKRGIS